MVDFIVEIPEGKTPVVLQLSDPQIIDSSQAVKGRLGDAGDLYWAKDKMEDRCFKYIREVVNNTSPDLILVAGDLIYGEFDHDGSALCSYVAFMESLGIPWAPVLGNHETESRMGVDWQCEQFVNAEFCLFKQRTLTGNGNYTVGIKQGDKLTRVFYMVDSNSGAPSEKSIANGHSQFCVGFADDQIEWYTNGINEIHRTSPDTKITFVFHIPIFAFEKAYEKYGYTSDETSEVFPICIDDMDETGTDFGTILLPFGYWDKDCAVWNGLKELGVDSICVGHDHEICVSAVFDGIRCQFGLKSSTYDSNIYVNKDSKLIKSFVAGGKPLIGGTVMELTPGDGTIEKAYNYYCQNVTYED